MKKKKKPKLPPYWQGQVNDRQDLLARLQEIELMLRLRKR